MFDKLGIYQTRFWLENKTVKIIEKSSSRFLLELFSKVDDLTDRDLVYSRNINGIRLQMVIWNGCIC